MTAALHPLHAPTAGLGWALLLLAVAWSVRATRTAETAGGLGWKWWTLAAAILLCFRWPLLGISHALNPDESHLIAGAITLRHDPLFWRSVDGATAGPLNYYPLLPAAWADGFASYIIARLIALAVAFGAVVFAGQALALAVGAAVTRVALLPALAAMAFTSDPDFLHYSTELMPMLLLAAAAYCAMRRAQHPTPAQPWVIGVLLGSVLWAKLQAVPMAAGLWILISWRECQSGRVRSLLPLVIGGLLPAVACLALVTLAGQAEHMIVPYFLSNFGYVGTPQMPWSESLWGQWLNALTDGYLGFWFAGALLVLIPLGAWWIRVAPTAARKTALAGVLFFAVALFSALAPRRLTAHHLLLLPLPLVWLAGVTLVMAWNKAATSAAARSRLLVTLLFLGAALVPQLALRAAGYNPFAAMNAATDKPTRRELVSLVRRFSAPGEPLAMWGWRCGLYVEAHRRQATRQAQTETQIWPSPLQPYFLRRYFEDFISANPPVFADAVGPGNFGYVNRAQAHESFPLLRAWVQEHYTQIADLDGTRLYVRNDRLAALAPSLSAPTGP